MALIKAFTKSDSVDYNTVIGNNFSGLFTNLVITNSGDVESEVSIFVVDGMNYFNEIIPPKKTIVKKLDCLLTNESLTFKSTQPDVFANINVIQS
jgi:hypothetical protein